MMKKLIVLESGKLSYSDIRMNNLTDQSYKELLIVNDRIAEKYKVDIVKEQTREDEELYGNLYKNLYTNLYGNSSRKLYRNVYRNLYRNL